MHYIDISRFIYSLEDAPGPHNSVVLEQEAYLYPSTGYRVDQTSQQRTQDIVWDNIWWVTLRVQEYSFAIEQQWQDLLRVFENSQPALWLSISNITGADCTQKIFELLPSVDNKRVYIELQHLCIPGVHEPYTVQAELTPAVYDLVDVHYPISENRTRFVGIHPQQNAADYASKPEESFV